MTRHRVEFRGRKQRMVLALIVAATGYSPHWAMQRPRPWRVPGPRRSTWWRRCATARTGRDGASPSGRGAEWHDGGPLRPEDDRRYDRGERSTQISPVTVSVKLPSGAPSPA
ncbi:MAG: hypothetical protein L0H84_10190, partial [Pseudonocardia sp.]|nr:hypothetical protein [Pseudonocardia sp.]